MWNRDTNDAMTDDEQLHAAALAGEAEAFAPIVERYQDAVFGIALARLRSFHDAQDVAQQIFKEEMMTMVEDVLRAESPNEDFGRRVFEVLNCYGRAPIPWPRWEEVAGKLRAIGSEGIEGFVQALESPHSPTRSFATMMLTMAG